MFPFFFVKDQLISMYLYHWHTQKLRMHCLTYYISFQKCTRALWAGRQRHAQFTSPASTACKFSWTSAWSCPWPGHEIYRYHWADQSYLVYAQKTYETLYSNRNLQSVIITDIM